MCILKKIFKRKKVKEEKKPGQESWYNDRAGEYRYDSPVAPSGTAGNAYDVGVARGIFHK